MSTAPKDPTAPAPPAATFPVNFSAALPLDSGDLDDAEEIARAEVYGLLTALFQAAPSAELYAALQVAVTEAPTRGAFLETSWSTLVGASRRLTLAQVEDEFVALFQGIGKPEVFLHGSYFIAGHLNEKPLVDLRHDLIALGLERPIEVLQTEDHLSNLCEVMRYLIAGIAEDAGPDAPPVPDHVRQARQLAAQQRFFNRHLRSWNEALWDVLSAHPRADFYAAVAGFGRDFFAVEAQGFDLLEA